MLRPRAPLPLGEPSQAGALRAPGHPALPGAQPQVLPGDRFGRRAGDRVQGGAQLGPDMHEPGLARGDRPGAVQMGGQRRIRGEMQQSFFEKWLKRESPSTTSTATATTAIDTAIKMQQQLQQ